MKVRRWVNKRCQRSVEDFDPNLTDRAATAFIAAATQYANELRAQGDRSRSDQYAQNHPGETIAAAVNAAFAVELRLKLVLRVLDQPIPRWHDARRLFKKLSADTRAEIRHQFDEWAQSRLGNKIVDSVTIDIRSNRIRHTREGVTPPVKRPRAKAVGNLSQHLKRNRGSFVAWRYVFSDVEEYGSSRRLHFDFAGQIQLCRILRRVAADIWEHSRGPIEDIDPPPAE